MTTSDRGKVSVKVSSVEGDRLRVELRPARLAEGEHGLDVGQVEDAEQPLRRQVAVAPLGVHDAGNGTGIGLEQVPGLVGRELRGRFSFPKAAAAEGA